MNMLIGFRIENFRSFKEMQYFSMLGGKSKSNDNYF